MSALLMAHGRKSRSAAVVAMFKLSIHEAEASSVLSPKIPQIRRCFPMRSTCIRDEPSTSSLSKKAPHVSPTSKKSAHRSGPGRKMQPHCELSVLMKNGSAQILLFTGIEELLMSPVRSPISTSFDFQGWNTSQILNSICRSALYAPRPAGTP